MSGSRLTFGIRSPVWNSWQVLRHFGPRWSLYRLNYGLLRRSGWLAWRERISRWEDVSASPALRDVLSTVMQQPEAVLAGESQFFVSPDLVQRRRVQLDQYKGVDGGVVRQAEHIAQGEFEYFHNQQHRLGTSPDWHANVITGQEYPRDLHWSRIDDFAGGDIKVVWDLSRFAFAFDLARAYARTQDEQWPALFWILLEDWRIHNPPNRGPNWKCGQEAAIRSMAWCFALFVMAGSPHTTPARVRMLLEMLAFSAYRITQNIEYAVSQRNNHGISEAVGLYTIASVLGASPTTEKWKGTARRLLCQSAREVSYDDGACSQHSWNYQRMMLQCYVWAIRLADCQRDPFLDDVVERVQMSGELLEQVMDPETGRVPRYGNDDGSLVLPLNECAYDDFRPVVQAVSVVTTGKRRFQHGLWDEDLHWLFDGEPPNAQCDQSTRSTYSSKDTGYVVLRSDDGFAFSRAGILHHRPGQADMLHVDVWWKGQNIAIDPGTFTYNGQGAWDYPFAKTWFHNTVTVDGRDQMERVGRFVWLPWLKASALGPLFGEQRSLTYWQGEHNGYQRVRGKVRHRRAILRLAQEHWLVLDQMDSRIAHCYRLHWLLADHPFELSRDCEILTLKTPAGPYLMQTGVVEAEPARSVIRGDESSPRGWMASGYQKKTPAISLAVVVEAASCRFWTLLGPASSKSSVEADNSRLHVTAGNWGVDVLFARESQRSIVATAQLRGKHDDLVHNDRIAIVA